MTMAAGPPKPPSITDGTYCSTPGILEAIPLDIARHPLRHKPLVIGTPEQRDDRPTHGIEGQREATIIHQNT